MNKKDNGKIKKLTAIITSGVICVTIVMVLIISGNSKSESKGSCERERHEITIVNADTPSVSADSTTRITTGNTDEGTTGKTTTETKTNSQAGSETGNG